LFNGVINKGDLLGIVLYVHSLDLTSFPLRPIDELRLEIINTIGINKYVNHRSFGVMGDKIIEYNGEIN
jgi:hypothetical protein